MNTTSRPSLEASTYAPHPSHFRRPTIGWLQLLIVLFWTVAPAVRTNAIFDARGNRNAFAGGTQVPDALDGITSRALDSRGFGVFGLVAPQAKARVMTSLAPLWMPLAVNPVTGEFHNWWDVPIPPPGEPAPPVPVESRVQGMLLPAGGAGHPAVAEERVNVVVPPGREALSYDAAGRLLEDAFWFYTWDDAGRLLCQTRKWGTFAVAGTLGETLAFGYDADGRRTVKRHTWKDSGTHEHGKESRMLWAGWLPVMEDRTRTEGGVTTSLPRRWFQWGADLSGTLEGAAGIGGLVAIIEEGGRTLLPMQDGLGNITATIDAATGQTVSRYSYGPFGETLGESGDEEACPFRWQTKWYDAECQHYYFGYRHYDPRLGRWLSRDPLGEEGGFNLYAYCGNDPVNHHDPLGLADWSTVVQAQRAEELVWIAEQTGNIGDSLAADYAIRHLPVDFYEPWVGAIFNAYGSVGLARYVGCRNEIMGMAVTGVHGGLIIGEGAAGAALMLTPDVSGLTKVGGGLLLSNAADQLQSLYTGTTGYEAALRAVYGDDASNIREAVLIKDFGLVPLALGSGFRKAYQPLFRSANVATRTFNPTHSHPISRTGEPGRLMFPGW